MWAGIVQAVGKLLDFLNLIFGHIFKQSDAKQSKKDTAQKNMDKAVKDDDPDAFLDGLADKHGA